MDTRVPGVNSLLVAVVASRSTVIERTRAKDHFGAVEAWDKSWEPPKTDVPTFKFRNDNLEEFGTNYYVLAELLNSKVHPFRKRYLSSIFPRIRD